MRGVRAKAKSDRARLDVVISTAGVQRWFLFVNSDCSKAVALILRFIKVYESVMNFLKLLKTLQNFIFEF